MNKVDKISCPVCHHGQSHIKSSRPSNGQIYRIRVCDGCGHEYRTVEAVVNSVSAASAETVSQFEKRLINAYYIIIQAARSLSDLESNGGSDE